MMNIKDKRKGFLCILLLLCLCLSVAFGCDCGKKETPVEPVPATETSKLHFVSRTMSLYVYEERTIEIEEDVDMTAVQWESDNTEIAEVDANGKVFAKSEGKATVTATMGNDSDKCVITVKKSDTLAKLKVNLDNYTLKLNETFTYPIQVTSLVYDGNEYTDFTCTYSSNDDGVAEIDGDGLVTAVKEGEATITVNASWRGTVVTCYINVTVLDRIYISISNEYVTNGINVYAYSPQGFDFKTSETISDIGLYNLNNKINGVEFSAREIAEESEKGKVAVYQDGKINAVGAVGKTEFQFFCEYQGKEYVSAAVPVTVNIATGSIKDKVFADKNSSQLDLKQFISFNKLNSVSIDGENKAVNGEKVGIEGITFGSHTVVFAVDDKPFSYSAELVVADKLISDIADLKGIKATDYCVLVADIDGKGAKVTHLFTADNWNTVGANSFANYAEHDNGFQGTFDGNGHTISNITVDSCGLFGNIGSHATVKNLGLYNITAEPKGYNFAFGLAMYVYGTVENVSYHQSAETELMSVIGVGFNAKITNFVSYTTNMKADGFINSLSPAANTLTNVYVISNKKSRFGKWFDIATYKTDPNFTEIDFVKIFDINESNVWEIDTELCLPLIKRACDKFITEKDYEKWY